MDFNKKRFIMVRSDKKNKQNKFVRYIDNPELIVGQYVSFYIQRYDITNTK